MRQLEILSNFQILYGILRENHVLFTLLLKKKGKLALKCPRERSSKLFLAILRHVNEWVKPYLTLLSVCSMTRGKRVSLLLSKMVPKITYLPSFEALCLKDSGKDSSHFAILAIIFWNSGFRFMIWTIRFYLSLEDQMYFLYYFLAIKTFKKY